MRIVLNYLPAAETSKTGIGHYTAELLRCLRRQAGDDVIDTFSGARSQRAWSQRADAMWSRFVSFRRRFFQGVRSGDRLSEQTLIRQPCRWKKYQLYHEPNYIPLPTDLPTVATVHDLSVLLHPEWHPADRVAHFERGFRSGLRQCRHFLAISEFARQEIIHTLNLRPEQVTRTYMGTRPGLRPLPEAMVQRALRRLKLPSRYLLYVGTLEPRKNLVTLLRAYRALEARIRRDYPLVLVGKWGWNVAEIVSFLDGKDAAEQVIHLGYVPEKDLSALYNGARALVFPSLYEGFGMPPMEMLACGGAVLASTAGAVAETVGRQAHLIEPMDVDGWHRAMQRVIENDDWWQQLRRGAVEAAKPFTWEQCAADTLRVYRMLCRQEKELKQPLAA